ncbi:probable glutathione S-transferase 5 [Apostichopus japonicus]|uniref:probable glutathione S-transferase 5 n=1 Tax=Stichopus japonicus TaxID=307972 RepID=UPI003AB3BB6C
MSTYKLTYFDFRGAGETSRYIFAVAEQEYEDVRVQQHEWKNLKPATPLGKLPVLNVDGKDIPQSMAIHRFLARRFDLYGKNDFEEAEIDVVIEVIQDLFKALTKLFYAETDELKARYKKEFFEVEGPQCYKFLEKLLTANDGGDGYFVGSKISLADIIAFVTTGDLLADRNTDYYLEVKEPKLKAFIERMKSLPQIDAWMKKRPQTDRVFSVKIQ